MKTGVDEEDRLYQEHADSVAGDYLEQRAERDCLVAVSACPGRGNRSPQWGHRPLLLQVLAEE